MSVGAAVGVRAGRRAGDRRRGLVAALSSLALLLGACVLASGLRVDSSGRPIVGSAGVGGKPAGLSRLGSLPLQAQSVISAALGSGLGGFAATRAPGGWRLAGGGVRADLTHEGVSVRSAGGSVSLLLSGVGRGGRLRPAGGVESVVARGNRVDYRGAGLLQWFAAGPLGIEQGFTLARRPAGARGPLTVALALGGSLRALRAGSQVEFLTHSGRVAVRYGALAAVDASGRRLPAAIVLRGRSMLLQIADRGARYPLRIDPLVQQGAKLVANNETPAGSSSLGDSAALSSNGSTALIGGPLDNKGAGAAWVFVRSGTTWTQQAKLVGTGASPPPVKGLGNEQGTSVALSADGDTALVGGPRDNSGSGAVWVYTRSGSTWTQTQELTPSNEVGGSGFGASLALSAAGSTALIGGPRDNGEVGAAWTFMQEAGSFVQQQKLTVTDESSAQVGEFGATVALSGDASTALIGGPFDNSQGGAAWVFTHPSNTWTEAAKLVGTGNVGVAGQGSSVALSEDGGIALVGGPFDNSDAGAAWVFAPSGTGGRWTQQQKLTASNETGGSVSQFGTSVSLSSDGFTALIGGPDDNTSAGAAWLFADTGGSWSDQQKLTGTGETGASGLGSSVALSGDRGTALAGGPSDNGTTGAAWVFAQPPPAVTSTAVSASKDPSVVGDTVTFTAAVSPAPDGGTIGFTDGTNPISGCGAVTVVAGAAHCTVTFTTARFEEIIATYSGDAKFQGSNGVFVEQVGAAATATALSASKNPSAFGDLVTFTAAISPAPDGGTVSFTDSSNPISGCGAVAVSAGIAKCSVTETSVGNHAIRASYVGDQDYTGSSAALSEAVGAAPTTTVLTSSANPTHAGQQVTITATVTPAPDGGTVKFSNAHAGFFYPGCEAVNVSAGEAKCQITVTSVNSSTPVDAAYVGDTNFQFSTAGELDLNVLPAALSNSTIAISLAQVAGDRAQTGSSGDSVSYKGVPLVAGRSTLVRVFTDPDGVTVLGSPALTATLSGSVNGHSLSGSPLKSDHGAPTEVGGSFDTQLGIASTAFNFVLPSSWTTGDVKLTAHVSSHSPVPAGAPACASTCQASLTLKSVKFTDIPKFEVTPVALTWTQKGTGKLMAPGNPQAAMALAYEMMPVHKIVNEGYAGTIDITSLQSDPGGLGGNQADTDGLNAVYQWAQTQFSNTCCTATHALHDMVVGFNVGIARGDTYIDPNIGTVVQGTKTLYSVFEPTAVVNAPNSLAVAHEMGHGVGRHHADHDPVCGGAAAGGSDPDWPDYRGHIEPTTNLANGVAAPSQTSAAANSFGVNLAWRVPATHGTGPFVIFPDTTYDLMSYCGNPYETPPTATTPGTMWTSARGWQQEFDCVKSNPSSGCPHNEQQPSYGEVAQSAGVARAATAAPTPTVGPAIRGASISFIGYVEPGGSLLSPSLMPSTGGTTGPSKSPFTATLTSRQGKVVATEPLSYQPVHIDPSPGHPALALVALQGAIPTHGQAVSGLVVRSGGTVRDRITAPRQAPRVTVRTPRIKRGAKKLTLRWNSHDSSKIRRTVFISFSTNGRRYTTTWEGFDRGRATISLTALGGHRRVRLRVSVNDGFQTSIATTRVIHVPLAAKPASIRPRPAWMVELERDGIDLVNP